MSFWSAKYATSRQPALLKAGFKEEDLPGLAVYGPVGCDACNGGYKGRVGIYQVMPVTEEIGAIIMRGGNQLDIEKQARKEGVPDLRQAGLMEGKDGVTSMEEREERTQKYS